MQTLPTQAEARATESALDEMRKVAQVELDRLAELYKQAGERYNDSIGKMGEKRMFKDAIGMFNRIEATKQAYASLGITGYVGVHYISVKVGA
jgi:hypothetical protein